MKFLGNTIEYEIFGGSHEPEIGVIAKGLPAGEKIDLEKLQAFLKRRAPGGNNWSTPRKEADIPVFESGLDGDTLTGDVLRAVIKNTNTKSSDYKNILDVPRPGHADFTAHIKYGDSVNMAGGGPFSGRMTAPMCILGGICLQILEKRGVTIGAHIVRIGSVEGERYDPVNLTAKALLSAGRLDFPAENPQTREKMKAEIEKYRQMSDSVGGIAECGITGFPAGIGGPMNEGLESAIAAIVFAIPAVKGIEFGAGFGAAEMTGSRNNDPFIIENGQIRTAANNHGGILGGISSGMPIIFRAAFKPTPSIGLPQQSVSLSRREPETLIIKGRHDPCIVPRAVPVLEAAAAIALLDAYLGDVPPAAQGPALRTRSPRA